MRLLQLSSPWQANLQIDGTFTASTGLHTLSGAGKV